LCPNFPQCNDQFCENLHPKPINLPVFPEICTHYPDCKKGDYCDYWHIDM